MHATVKKVLDTAVSQDGVTEKPPGSNRGPEVEAYLRATGLGPGSPWCAAFEAWCIAQVEKADGITIAWPKTASCDVILTFARRHDILYTAPQPGDAFLVLATANDATHTGFVHSVSATKFATVEGNSNNNGSRDGLGVVRLKRPISSRYRFVRWGDLLPGVMAPDLTWELFINDKKIADVPVSNGVARVAVQTWAKALGITPGWDGEERAVLLDNRPVPATPLLLGGKAYLPVRALAEFSALNVDVDSGKKKITVSRLRV